MNIYSTGVFPPNHKIILNVFVSGATSQRY
nr:MAG TPA: hypothetical protein [Caudoviricetes sp.]